MEGIIYLDNAATTFPKPDIVYETMDKFYRSNGVNVGRGQYDLASKAAILVQETRELIYELFNCNTEKRVVFTSSSTEAINIILQGISWQGGENVYITHFEHNAVLRTLNAIKDEHNLNIHYIDTDRKKLNYDLEKIEIQFQENNPDVVIINHASNVCGLISPVKEISKIAKNYNAKVLLDCSQTAGLLDIDLKKVLTDYVVFAGHKTLFGPFGIAGFITDTTTDLKPLLFGGTGIHSGNLNLPNTVPEKFEVGSMNIYAIAGLNAAIKWIMKIGIDSIRDKERILTERLIKCIKQFDTTIHISDNLDSHIGVVSCNFNEIPADNIGNLLSSQNVAVRTGLHCAPDAHRLLGTFPGGSVRFSVSFLNEIEEIESLEEILETILY